MNRLKRLLGYSSKRLLLFAYLFATLGLILMMAFNKPVYVPFLTLDELYRLLNHESLLIIVVLCIILFFLLTGILLLSLLFGYTIQKRRKEKTQQRYSAFLIETLFSRVYEEKVYTDEQKKQISKSFKRELRNDRETMLVIDTLRKVHEQTMGIIQVKTARILDILDYRDFLQACLHSPQANDKLFALMVISEFKLEIELKYIHKLTAHRNKSIRSAAIACLVRFEAFSDLSFLTQYSFKLSAWDINILVQSVKDGTSSVIAYEQLLGSEHADVVLLGILLSKQHLKIEFRESIRNHIQSKHAEVAEEATLALIRFSVFSSDFVYLIQNYPNLTYKAKKAIVQSMESCSSKTVSLPFLESVVQEEPMEMKVVALTCLLKIDMETFSKYNKDSSGLIHQACMEVLDYNL